jgi:2-polyprenyl-3-methyl-5-hydroxy-6-metoxy-1,4-benzoquinol methylase
MSTATLLMDKWTAYRDSRRGSYEYRSRTRYNAVLDRLMRLGLRVGDSIIDVGAGTCQFGRYLHECGWSGEYTPVDAVIDGTDLERWTAPPADFIVCIEVVEHLHHHGALINTMVQAARRGVVLTTPNSEAVDVIACDPTHVSVVPAWALEVVGFTVERHSWFGVPQDSLLAWRRHVNA